MTGAVDRSCLTGVLAEPCPTVTFGLGDALSKVTFWSDGEIDVAIGDEHVEATFDRRTLPAVVRERVLGRPA